MYKLLIPTSSAYCYTQLASSRTNPVWGLTFSQLDKEIPDIGSVTELWCKNKCSEKLLPYVWRCYTDPVIKPFVVKKISDQFDWAKGEVAKYEDILAGSPIGRIVTVVSITNGCKVLLLYAFLQQKHHAAV